ncbi:MAG: hypothetical protein DCC55_16630 [Chloroflexi bacterium]|nr:MAG: hypothetical protein DCC55_16630 [Chloroflexota bacterium]
MLEIIERVELQIDQDGQVALPKELQERLEPGVALVVETRHNGTIALRLARVQVAQLFNKHTPVQPQLIDKDGLLIIRDEVPIDFDWDSLLQDREAPLHNLEQIA